MTFDLADLLDYEYAIASVRIKLDEATFTQSWEEGRSMTIEQAIELASRVTHE